MADKPNVVLVHGGFVDGSGWQGVYDLLTDRRLPGGRRAEPDPVPRGRRGSHAHGPRSPGRAHRSWWGHSYGGAMISEAGTHERVAALAYISAFGPDAGESVNTLIDTFPAGGPQPPILPPVDGFLLLDRDKFHASFAGDLSVEQAAFMADSQVPVGRGRPRRRRQRARLAEQAELVPGHNRGSDDPARRTADDGRAPRRDRRRGRREPLGLRLSTCCRRRPDQASGNRRHRGEGNRKRRVTHAPFALPETRQRKGLGLRKWKRLQWRGGLAALRGRSRSSRRQSRLPHRASERSGPGSRRPRRRCGLWQRDRVETRSARCACAHVRPCSRPWSSAVFGEWIKGSRSMAMRCRPLTTRGSTGPSRRPQSSIFPSQRADLLDAHARSRSPSRKTPPAAPPGERGAEGVQLEVVARAAAEPAGSPRRPPRSARTGRRGSRL